MSYCARCHENGAGCCLIIPGCHGDQFGLTRGEIDRIVVETGIPEADFTDADRADPRFMAVLDAIHPAFRLTMPEGRRIRLKVDVDRCHLLGSEGCVLPEALRPLYCRIYPFWFDARERLILLRATQCLAQEDAISPYEVMRRLEMDENVLRSLFAQWLQFVREHRV
jgi:Fe-S-cluster containining protein